MSYGLRGLQRGGADMLVQRIEAAHAQYARSQSQKDYEQLWALQTEYRNTATLVRPGGEARLTGAFSGSTSVIDRPRERSTAPWPASIAMHRSLHSEFRNLGFDGREEGGFLIGYAEPAVAGAPLDVLQMFKASDEWESNRRSTHLLVESALTWPLRSGEAIIGCWHSHPPNGSHSPSDQDIQASRSMAEGFGRSEWLSVIAVERRDDSDNYLDADVVAFLVRSDSGRAYFKAIDITEWRL